jgi:integrase
MPCYFDAQKQRWRFTFNRIIGAERHRASRLLPKGWSRAQAEAYDRKETGRLYALAAGIEREEFLIDDAVALYLRHRIPKQKAGHKAALHLAALLPYYEGRRLSQIADVSREFAEAAHGLGTGTVHNRLAYLKAACRYAWKHHWKPAKQLEHDPTAGMSVPAADNERHVYITVAQLNMLLRKFDSKESAALTKMAFYTGLRWIADLLPRQPADVRRLGRQVWLYVGMTKNGTPRMVPIHDAIRPCLKFLPFERHWRDYYADFEVARERAGLGHVNMHDLRHSLASAIVSKGGTLVDVAAALHHKSVASSKRYAHLYPRRVRKVIMGV